MTMKKGPSPALGALISGGLTLTSAALTVPGSIVTAISSTFDRDRLDPSGRSSPQASHRSGLCPFRSRFPSLRSSRRF